MKYANALFICMMFAMTLAGCANKDSGGGATAVPVTPGTYNGVNSTCQAGFVPSQYGCLAQAGCPAGFGMYNNQCIPASAIGNNPNLAASCQGTCPAGHTQTAQYGCLPQDVCRSCYGLYGTGVNAWCIPAAAVSGVGNSYNMW